MSIDSKQTNPKDTIGTTKLPMNLVPASVIAYASLAWLEGMTKYGGVNWRNSGVRVSIYVAALQRHLSKYYDGGEWADPKTQVPHLASIIACAGIILDAKLANKLVDDRPLPQRGLPALIDQLSSTVEHLKKLHAEMNPHHFTVQDETKTVTKIEVQTGGADGPYRDKANQCLPCKRRDDSRSDA